MVCITVKICMHERHLHGGIDKEERREEKERHGEVYIQRRALLGWDI